MEIPSWLAVVANLSLAGVVAAERWLRRKDVDAAVIQNQLTRMQEDMKELREHGSNAVTRLEKDLAVLRNDHENLKRFTSHATDGDR